MCEYSSSSLFEPKLDLSIFEKTSNEQVEFFWGREKTSNISVSPSWSQLLNPHHFDTHFDSLIFTGWWPYHCSTIPILGMGVVSLYVEFIYTRLLARVVDCSLPVLFPYHNPVLLKTIGTRLKINQLQKITLAYPIYNYSYIFHSGFLT